MTIKYSVKLNTV